MKLTEKNDFIEQLNANEMSELKGGASENEQVGEQTETQSNGDGKIVYINGKPYRVEKDGSVRPLS